MLADALAETHPHIVVARVNCGGEGAEHFCDQVIRITRTPCFKVGSSGCPGLGVCCRAAAAVRNRVSADGLIGVSASLALSACPQYACVFCVLFASTGLLPRQEGNRLRRRLLLLRHDDGEQCVSGQQWQQQQHATNLQQALEGTPEGQR